MISKHNYDIGDVISMGKPFVHVLELKNKNVYCDYCLKKNSELKKCNACKQMYYCDKECQKNDWKKHKFECKILLKHNSILTHDLERYFLRLYLFIENNPNLLINNNDNGDNRCFMDLMTHKDEIKNDSIRMKALKTIILKFRLINEINVDYDKINNCFCRLVINSFSILNAELNAIGCGLYLNESKFDHSCQPNASSIYMGHKIIIRAIRPINVNEKITINYIDMKLSKKNRQDQLLKQYYFYCKCDRCEKNDDDDIDYDKFNNEIKMMDQAIGREKFEDAYNIGKKIMPIYRKTYGKCHPDLTVQLVRLLKLLIYITPVDKFTNIDSIDSIEEFIEIYQETKQAITWTNNMKDDEIYQTFITEFRLKDLAL